MNHGRDHADPAEFRHHLSLSPLIFSVCKAQMRGRKFGLDHSPRGFGFPGFGKVHKVLAQPVLILKLTRRLFERVHDPFFQTRVRLAETLSRSRNLDVCQTYQYVIRNPS
jgi:hypothetical protein